MNYAKIYENLMNKAKSLDRVKGENEYFESHHVVPNFLFKNRKRRSGPAGHLEGDPDASANLVLLTAREHFLSHLLLVKIYSGTRYECSAKKSLVWFFTLIKDSKHTRKEWYNIASAKKYEKYRILAVDGIRQSVLGKMPVKDAITGVKIGRVEVSHPNVISGKWVHITKGRKSTDEQRIKDRIRSTGMLNSNAKTNITEEIIIETLIKYIISNNKAGKHLLKSEILTVLKHELDISSMILKNRFDKTPNLIAAINNELTKRDIPNIAYESLYRSEEQKLLISNSLKTNKWRWVTDGVKSLQIKQADLKKFFEENPEFKNGRTQ